MIRLANACDSPEQADFLVNAISILAERQSSGQAVFASLKIIGRLPAGTTANGELMVPAPVDYVTWTEEVAGFAQRDDLGAAPKTLLHTGRFSPTAAAGMTAAGWKLIKIDGP
jgi:hypothetical protein